MSETAPEQDDTRERAGAVIPWIALRDRPTESRITETAGLVEALGCDLAFIRDLQIRVPSASHLLSSGLLEEIRARLEAENCTVCIVDGSLSPVQQRNLERVFGMKVIDRTGLILEIFGLRARTREGQLQVELARISYERSRLVRTWTHLERQRGGRGFLSGPGETQLEADRRMLDRTMKALRADLDDVKRTRGLQREGRVRAGTPVISLVGYTNSGKSTLFNRLSGASVLAKDMPFATLDPTIRKIELPVVGTAALVDTVGFITDLPTHLIDAFQATLEEAVQSDLLIHVRDRASPADEAQRADVISVLEMLQQEAGRPLPPLIEAWNKADLMDPDRRSVLEAAAREAHDPPAVLVSALTGEGLPDLIDLAEKVIMGAARVYRVEPPVTDGRARAWLHAHGDVIEEAVDEQGCPALRIRLSDAALGQFQAKFPTSTVTRVG